MLITLAFNAETGRSGVVYLRAKSYDLNNSRVNLLPVLPPVLYYSQYLCDFQDCQLIIFYVVFSIVAFEEADIKVKSENF